MCGAALAGWLSWYEPAKTQEGPEDEAKAKKKLKGSLRLFSSSSVELARDGPLSLEVISSNERLTLSETDGSAFQYLARARL